MRFSDFDAIIFDSDGVLVDSEIIHVAVERELLSELGLNYDHETYLSRFVGLSNANFYSELKMDYARHSDREFPTDFGSMLFERTWPRIEAELLPIGGVAELVGKFPGKVAVGSSAPYDRLCRKLTIANLASLFSPHIYSADHVNKGKPEPDLFLYAAEQLGVSPRGCLVIEDSMNGVLAASAAGMVPIGFVGGSHADVGLGQRLLDHGAVMIASSHSEIKALI